MISLRIRWNDKTLNSLWNDPRWRVWSRARPKKQPVWCALKLVRQGTAYRLVAAKALRKYDSNNPATLVVALGV